MSGDERCKKCEVLLTRRDLECITNGKYCIKCGCRVYRWSIGQLIEERDAYKEKYEELVELLSGLKQTSKLKKGGK